MASEMIQIERPAPPAIVAELSPLVAQARAFSVTDIDTDRIAQERGRNCRLGEKAIEDHFAKTKRALIDAKRAFDASVAAMVGPIAEARSVYFAKSDTFQAEERRKAQEQERVLQERARKEEEERQIQAAIDAEACGDNSGAAAILDERTEVPVLTVAPAIAAVKGLSSSTRWSPEVYDVRACLAFLIVHDEWASALEKLIPTLETIFRPLATAQRQAMAIPGVRAVSKTVRATR